MKYWHSLRRDRLSVTFTLVFVKDGVRYVCVEQYIQARKAEIFDDDIAHAKIMNSLSPHEMKKIGSRVKYLWAKCGQEKLRQWHMRAACKNSLRTTIY